MMCVCDVYVCVYVCVCGRVWYCVCVCVLCLICSWMVTFVHVHTSFRCSQHVRCAKIARKSPSGVLISCRHPEGILNPRLQISYEKLCLKCFLEKENSCRIYVFLGPQGVRIRGYMYWLYHFAALLNRETVFLYAIISIIRDILC